MRNFQDFAAHSIKREIKCIMPTYDHVHLQILQYSLHPLPTSKTCYFYSASNTGSNRFGAIGFFHIKDNKQKPQLFINNQHSIT